VFKVAISEARILGVDDEQVRFTYRKVGSRRPRTMALPAFEFLRRFLQHVLPAGFMKVRYFGFLSPSFAVPLEEVRARIELAQGFAVRAPEPAIEAPAPPCCRHRGGRLRYQRLIRPARQPLGLNSPQASPHPLRR
jgi:hypothetical protein